MTYNPYENDYFEWLVSLIDNGEGYQHYNNLLSHLYDREFTWRIPKDENRAADGEDLRYRFGRENGYSMDEVRINLDTKDCSVLEMLVALAVRCENEIMSNSNYGDRTPQWFWTMIFNLELGSSWDDIYDPLYVDYCLDRFMDREFNPDGSGGGIFILNGTEHDLRKIEFWYHMCYYVAKLAEGEVY